MAYCKILHYHVISITLNGLKYVICSEVDVYNDVYFFVFYVSYSSQVSDLEWHLLVHYQHTMTFQHDMNGSW